MTTEMTPQEIAANYKQSKYINIGIMTGNHIRPLIDYVRACTGVTIDLNRAQQIHNEVKKLKTNLTPSAPLVKQ
jgi:hypothetical protein